MPSPTDPTPLPGPGLPSWLSALADGQLAGAELQRALDVLQQDATAPEVRAQWHAVHLIGEVLRGGPAQVTAHDEAFLDRLRTRLQSVPVAGKGGPAPAEPDAPEVIASNPYQLRAEGQIDAGRPAANDPWFRWRLAGLASVVAVALIGWQVWQAGPGGSVAGSGAELALTAPGTSAVAVPGGAAAGPMLRDPHLDALLAAHRQFGGASALQQPSGFLRNATFESSGR